MTNIFDQKGHFSLDNAIATVSQPLNPKWIEQRKVGGTTLSYIGGHVVIRLLNKAFGYQWSFEIVNEQIVPSIPKLNKYAKAGQDPMEPQPPVVKILGRLTVPGLGVKEQYGSKVLIGGASEQESAFKSASTDALKKCASLFGIGLDLYGEAEGLENNISYDEQAPVQYAPVQESAPVQIPQQQPQQPVAQKFPTAAQAQEQGQLAMQQNENFQPNTDDAPAESQTVLTPNVQQAPAQPQAETSGPARLYAWPPQEVMKMRDLKAQLGVDDNSQLDPYVREFLNNPDVTIQNITPDSITAFNVFLSGKLA